MHSTARPRAAIPVTTGSPQFTARETECFRVVEAWFPARSVIEAHTHDRPVFAMMLRGGFRTDIGTRSLACDEGYAWTEPNAERHANFVSALGAHVLVIQPDPTRSELLEPIQDLLDGVRLLRHPALQCGAPGILAALRAPDADALAVESRVCEVLSSAANVHFRERACGPHAGVVAPRAGVAACRMASWPDAHRSRARGGRTPVPRGARLPPAIGREPRQLPRTPASHLGACRTGRRGRLGGAGRARGRLLRPEPFHAQLRAAHGRDTGAISRPDALGRLTPSRTPPGSSPLKNRLKPSGQCICLRYSRSGYSPVLGDTTDAQVRWDTLLATL